MQGGFGNQNQPPHMQKNLNDMGVRPSGRGKDKFSDPNNVSMLSIPK